LSELDCHGHCDDLARRGTPSTVADLAAHDLIGYNVETPALRAMAARLPALDRRDFALRTDSNLAQLVARSGLGSVLAFAKSRNCSANSIGCATRARPVLMRREA
jgi:hypothetical protein